MPLDKAKLGEVRQIKDVSGNDKIRKFLFSLGFSEGEEITLISKIAGNFVVCIKDCRYAIDQNMARSIELI